MSLRTYGRVYSELGVPTWTEVTTDANGYNDYVYVTALIQCLKLNLGESPFWANYGIPALQSVLTQVYPDFYMAQTQQQFAQYFASLIITKENVVTLPGKAPTPTYKVSILTHQGAKMALNIPV